VLIVGGSVARARLAQCLSADPGARIEVAGFLPLEEERRVESDWGAESRRTRPLRFEDLATVVRELDVDRVLLIPTTADPETMLDAVSRTTAIGVKVSIVPRLFEVVGSAVEFDTIGGVTVLGVPRTGLTRSSRAIKRAMDIVAGTAALVALAPIAVLVALAIKLDSPGPVLFFQRRVGRDDHTFTMIDYLYAANWSLWTDVKILLRTVGHIWTRRGL
jgi:Bacterial sugar transferase